MMSEYYDEWAGYDSLAEQAMEAREERANFRRHTWRTKMGQEVLIREMGDMHLFNAYKKTQDSLLFQEMVLRMFEQKMRDA